MGLPEQKSITCRLDFAHSAVMAWIHSLGAISTDANYGPRSQRS
jgi:hypothetical protein